MQSPQSRARSCRPPERLCVHSRSRPKSALALTVCSSLDTLFRARALRTHDLGRLGMCIQKTKARRGSERRIGSRAALEIEAAATLLVLSCRANQWSMRSLTGVSNGVTQHVGFIFGACRDFEAQRRLQEKLRGIFQSADLILKAIHVDIGS
jgi:hypothetical protein